LALAQFFTDSQLMPCLPNAVNFSSSEIMHPANGHSAEVKMFLHLDGAMLPISHMGPDFIRLRNPQAHEPCDGEVSLIIDGVEERWGVRLPNGIRPGEQRIFLARTSPERTAGCLRQG
jgi:hypothetical protein